MTATQPRAPPSGDACSLRPYLPQYSMFASPASISRQPRAAYRHSPCANTASAQHDTPEPHPPVEACSKPRPSRISARRRLPIAPRRDARCRHSIRYSRAFVRAFLASESPTAMIGPIKAKSWPRFVGMSLITQLRNLSRSAGSHQAPAARSTPLVGSRQVERRAQTPRASPVEHHIRGGGQHIGVRYKTVDALVEGNGAATLHLAIRLAFRHSLKSHSRPRCLSVPGSIRKIST